jgi:hypothetical protein
MSLSWSPARADFCQTPGDCLLTDILEKVLDPPHELLSVSKYWMLDLKFTCLFLKTSLAISVQCYNSE